MKSTKYVIAGAVALVLITAGLMFSSTGTKNNNKNMHVTLKTNMGDMTLELYQDKAPKTVANFIKLAKEGYYDGTKFHRVIHDFMIQGGDPQTKDDALMNKWGTGGPGYQFENENDKGNYTRGILAMANAGPNTNGSQFFIVTAENVAWFNSGYSIFGKITDGVETLMKIDGVKTNGSDRPLSPVVVEKVVVSE